MASNDSVDETKSTDRLAFGKMFPLKRPVWPGTPQSSSRNPGNIRRALIKILGKDNEGELSEHPDITRPQTPASSSRIGFEVSENVELTGRFLKTVITHVADIVDSNPVKAAFKMVKVVLDANDIIDGNEVAIARRIISTANQLNVVLEALGDAEWRLKDVEAQRLRQFENSMSDQIRALKELANASKLRKIMDHEDEQKRIKEIFENINEARILFELGIASKSFRVVTQIYEEPSDSRLERLKPSKAANHQYYLEGKEKEDRPRVTCTPGTRVRIMKDIVSWANNTASPSVVSHSQTGATISTHRRRLAIRE